MRTIRSFFSAAKCTYLHALLRWILSLLTDKSNLRCILCQLQHAKFNSSPSFCDESCECDNMSMSIHPSYIHSLTISSAERMMHSINRTRPNAEQSTRKFNNNNIIKIRFFPLFIFFFRWPMHWPDTHTHITQLAYICTSYVVVSLKPNWRARGIWFLLFFFRLPCAALFSVVAALVRLQNVSFIIIFTNCEKGKLFFFLFSFDLCCFFYI